MSVKVETITGSWARGIVIGDIHGCLTELKQILKKCGFSNLVVRKNPHILDNSHDSYSLIECGEINTDSTDDLCIFVGDLVNKGPNSYEVVRFLRALGAVGVLGNHDQKLLEIRNSPMREKYNKSSLYHLAIDCPEDVLVYLQHLPHIIRFPQWETIIVHAGLDPSLPLLNQGENSVTRMRRLKNVEESSNSSLYLSSSSLFHTIERGKKGQEWYEVWNNFMNTAEFSPLCGEPEYKNSLIVYGHDAKSGLQVHKFTIGLDTGCVYGRKLTCVALPTRILFQVNGNNAKL